MATLDKNLLRHILVQPNFASIPECEDLIYDAKTAISIGGEHVHKHPSVEMVYGEALTTSAAYDILCRRIVERIAEYHDGADAEVLDCGIVVKMSEGAAHARHADAELEDGSPNHTPHRKHVGLLYLSEWGQDHDGGILEVAGMTIPASTGLLASFPSTKDYMHEVSRITSGWRWSLNVWSMAKE